MKKVVFLLFVIPALISCESKDQKTKSETAQSAGTDQKPADDPASLTSIQWLDSTTRDLGKVTEGTMVDVSFRFKNTGDKNLVIESVQASCGCTVPDKPEKPIPPGGTDIIKAKFNSSGRLGANNKVITVTANTEPGKQHQLTFNVEVTK